MKNKKLKRIIAAAAIALTLGAASAFGGCMGSVGRDGVDGKDLNIYDIYQTTKQETGNPDLTFAEFLKEYLSYTPAQIEQQTSLAASINRSLLSSVSIQAQFVENGSAAAYSGSGVIIDIDKANGDMTVVTNCHVVYSAKANRYGQDGYSDTIYLWLYGSESDYTQTNTNNAIPATLIAASKTYDVAVLKVTGDKNVKRSQARAAEWTSSEESFVGETVYAIGNANSQTMSANVGYISKDLEQISVDLGDKVLGSTIYYNYNVLRTSAAINSGNSGGGLFNADGELVGLVNAKSKEDVAGFGYALTAASTKRVVKSMLDNYAATGAEAHYLNKVKNDKLNGIYVEVSDMYSTGLNPDGYAEIYEQVTVLSSRGAASGKVQSGDVLKHIKITRGNTVIEDLPVNREHNFYDAMLSVRAGDSVQFTVEREIVGEMTVTVEYATSDFEKVV